jgi:hypothetical protein
MILITVLFVYGKEIKLQGPAEIPDDLVTQF